MRSESLRITATLRVAVATALALMPGGCGSAGTPFAALARAPDEVTYAPSLGVNLEQMTKSPTGLYYQTLTEGEGTEAAAVGDLLEVDYDGWLHSGRRFDTTRVSGPLLVELGNGEQIPGFAEGLEGMHLNEVRLLVIPHELGYGIRRIGDIPPYAILVFRVELVSLQKAGTS